MNDREYTAAIVERLKEIYPDAVCSLEYGGDPWKLLVMGRLSAQCTDARVNEVCKVLFKKWSSAKELSEAPISEVEETVRSCGLYKMKARDIVGASKMLCENFGSKVPDTMEELLTLPGVGRKIANLLLGDLYKKPAVVVDTHCIRISGRMGLVPGTLKTPEKIEKILSALIEDSEQSDFCHRIVLLGREFCTARGHDCSICPLGDICRKA